MEGTRLPTFFIVPVRDYPRKVASTRKKQKIVFMHWKIEMEGDPESDIVKMVRNNVLLQE